MQVLWYDMQAYDSTNTPQIFALKALFFIFLIIKFSILLVVQK